MELRQRALSVLLTVGDADTLWHPQFFSAITFESQRMSEDGATADPSDGPPHGDVQIGEPCNTILRSSSRLLLVHHAAYPGMSSLGAAKRTLLAGGEHGRTARLIHAVSVRNQTVKACAALKTREHSHERKSARRIVGGATRRTSNNFIYFLEVF